MKAEKGVPKGVEGRRAEEKRQAIKLLAKRRRGRDAANEGETPSVRGSRKRPIGQGGGLEAKAGEVTEARRGSTGEERESNGGEEVEAGEKFRE